MVAKILRLSLPSFLPSYRHKYIRNVSTHTFNSLLSFVQLFVRRAASVHRPSMMCFGIFAHIYTLSLSLSLWARGCCPFAFLHCAGVHWPPALRSVSSLNGCPKQQRSVLHAMEREVSVKVSIWPIGTKRRKRSFLSHSTVISLVLMGVQSNSSGQIYTLWKGEVSVKVSVWPRGRMRR